jgi:hypothetical protein
MRAIFTVQEMAVVNPEKFVSFLFMLRLNLLNSSKERLTRSLPLSVIDSKPPGCKSTGKFVLSFLAEHKLAELIGHLMTQPGNFENIKLDRNGPESIAVYGGEGRTSNCRFSISGKLAKRLLITLLHFMKLVWHRDP